MYHYRVIEMRGLIFRKPSYGIRAEVQENGICTYATFLPDISCDKDFVEALAATIYHRTTQSYALTRCRAGRIAVIFFFHERGTTNAIPLFFT